MMKMGQNLQIHRCKLFRPVQYDKGDGDADHLFRSLVVASSSPGTEML